VPITGRKKSSLKRENDVTEVVSQNSTKGFARRGPKSLQPGIYVDTPCLANAVNPQSNAHKSLGETGVESLTKKKKQSGLSVPAFRDQRPNWKREKTTRLREGTSASVSRKSLHRRGFGVKTNGKGRTRDGCRGGEIVPWGLFPESVKNKNNRKICQRDIPIVQRLVTISGGSVASRQGKSNQEDVNIFAVKKSILVPEGKVNFDF